jgi:gamma-butyrobetaine dioxygenase
MIEHQLQAAALARAAGCSDVVVAAALLHDVGHMIGHHAGELVADVALAAETDAHHDVSGARWLSTWFAADVTEPVRLHVAAKRYLVATEPDYAAKLSPASVHTLRLQGGPMSPEEIADFEGSRHAGAAVAVRRFDEAAKDPRGVAPAIDSYRELIARVIRSGSDTR